MRFGVPFNHDGDLKKFSFGNPELMGLLTKKSLVLVSQSLYCKLMTPVLLIVKGTAIWLT